MFGICSDIGILRSFLIVVFEAVVIEFPSVDFAVMVSISTLYQTIKSFFHFSFSQWLLFHLLAEPVFELLPFQQATVVLVPFPKDVSNVVFTEIVVLHGASLIYYILFKRTPI